MIDCTAGLLNLDWNPIEWIGFWLTIQIQNWILGFNWQSSFSISIQIQKVQTIFINWSKNVWLLSCKLINDISLGNYMFQLQIKAFKICCHWIFLKVSGLWFWSWLDFDWIVNQFWKVDWYLDWQQHICDWFGLDCQSILKSGFVFGLTITYLWWI